VQWGETGKEGNYLIEFVIGKFVFEEAEADYPI
jgi:hypothetical protein